MNCKECLELLVDYLEQTLPSSHLADLEQHLHCCPPCVEYVRSYQLSIRISQLACNCEELSEAQEMPEQLVQSIMMFACRDGEAPETATDSATDSDTENDRG